MKPLAGLYVLVGDDNEDARELAKMELEYEGASVDVATTVAEAMGKPALFRWPPRHGLRAKNGGAHP